MGDLDLQAVRGQFDSVYPRRHVLWQIALRKVTYALAVVTTDGLVAVTVISTSVAASGVAAGLTFPVVESIREYRNHSV